MNTPRFRNRFRLAAVLVAPVLVSATAAPTAGIEVRVENLRNHDGHLKICITRAPEHFPDCAGDPAASKRSVPAITETVVFRGVAPGHYAVAIVHDENGNGKLDKMLGIPREGFGFSRNPKIRFGPPSFAEAEFDVAAGTTQQVVQVKYLL